MASKPELRARLKAIRQAMLDIEVKRKSQIIADKFINAVSLEDSSKVHIYTSRDSLNEVDTKPIFELIKKYPKIKIETSAAKKGANMPTKKFDLIVVPVLGFDRDNYRLGMGGGWYDRFLAQQPKALKIGLAYKSGFVPEDLPYESHDIPLDKIITDV